MKKIIIIIQSMILSSCNIHDKNSQRIPDIDNNDDGFAHGSKFTPLGCLLNGAWQYNQKDYSGYNVKVFLNEKRIPLGQKMLYSENDKNLVFRLLQNGKLRYWFMDNFIQASDNKVYNSGTWAVNFIDSTIRIDFGGNDRQLTPIIGKYIELDSDNLNLEEIIFFDEVIIGEKKTYKKIITRYFSHFEINLTK